tara:strand:- start:980 stop:1168 length:189 start_codon:yes stop_codon:yes gene_type:complete
MYEIQESNKIYNIVDGENSRCVGYTKNKKRAAKMIRMLKTRGFKGIIPNFFLNGTINFDLKT